MEEKSCPPTREVSPDGEDLLRLQRFFFGHKAHQEDTKDTKMFFCSRCFIFGQTALSDEPLVLPFFDQYPRSTRFIPFFISSTLKFRINPYRR
jgi:hypothetical protein